MTNWLIADLNEYLENKKRAECASEADLEFMRSEVRDFLSNVVVAALQNLREPLEKHGRAVRIFGNPRQDSISIQISFGDKREFDYSVKVDIGLHHAHPYV
ncbi:MAG: hypothetical protein EOP09_12990, partial [Proteobacteria bacterium]